ncbi:type I restriction endonuclease [uncultured Lamprocystis sp.]|jgi:type I site-specific restriction-modification system R (restriction) subunit|uniref:type I restriction endonuclease subunit R n=1 Tax=uncultured Lamprocystis sp. TaxID=543132 RepID=UPI0025D8F8E1|nr:type I restriction endonuclease [uncultured Lamprocystis sp.]
MALTDINSEDRLVQQTFADYLHEVLGWDSLYAWNQETFGPDGTLGRNDTTEVVLVRDLRAAIVRLNPELPEQAVNQAIEKLTWQDFSRSLLQLNQAFYRFIRDGVPVSYRDAKGQARQGYARVIDFRRPKENRFLCVRELKITGRRTPNYNRRADLICFVNGLPLVFFEHKAVYKNIRAGFEGNLRDYLDEHVIAHAFHHNAFLIVSNGHRARYGSITSEWEHFAEWKRQDERDQGSVDAEVLLNGMLAKERLLDLVENFILFDASKPGAVRKIIASNHQVLGVNLAVDAVIRQEALKRAFPPGERLRSRVIELPLQPRQFQKAAEEAASYLPEGPIELLELRHADLGRLGVFWHTQGSGKSYSMAFFTEKVRRRVPGNFTFVLMTGRNDLDNQIYRTFVGCGVADERTPRAGTGKDLEQLLKENHRYIADDFVAHCATRWASGKSLLVCIDKITCARVQQRILPRWQAKAAAVRRAAEARQADLKTATDPDLRQRLYAQRDRLMEQAQWLDETIIGIIISEGQNEVADFKKWDFDIIPHRALMKQGFETADGKRVDVETAFKNPDHPFRVAIVCAMWLTGFDVECLFTLYIDKPMKAHTLMQAIARANRRYPGKDFGLIVDYNGMLKSLRAALAQYALGDEGTGDEAIVAPIEERVQALLEAIGATEAHIRGLGFKMPSLLGAQGFARIKGIADAVDAVYTSDESKRRFEILARQVFARFRALLMEPAAFTYAERHDNLEAIYKKLTERRDTADVTDLLKALHRIVNQAIRTQEPGADQAEGLTFDLSQIDLERLRAEFAKKVRRKATVLKDIRELVEQKLAEMLKRNPQRMDYYKRYQEIIADYNREKDRVTIEETFAKLTELLDGLDEEQRRAAEEGLSEDELALFDLLRKDNLGKAERETVKQASRALLASLRRLLAPLERWTEKEQTQAEVETTILDQLYRDLPSPPFTDEDKQAAAAVVYRHVWQQSVSGAFSMAA